MKITKRELKEMIMEEVKSVLNQKLNETPSFEDDSEILEMATFAAEKWGKETYIVSVHGQSSKDRDTPHLHIYLAKDINPYNLFNFEISLTDLLCKDELNLIFQMDKSKNLRITNRRDCSWTGYREIYKGIKELLPYPCNEPYKWGVFKDFLEKGIYEWSRETNYIETVNNGKNMLRLYFEEKGLTPLPKYKEYLDDFKKDGITHVTN